MGSTLEEKNLLLEEQIHFFKSRPQMRWEDKTKIRFTSPESVPIHLKHEGEMFLCFQKVNNSGPLR